MNRNKERINKTCKAGRNQQHDAPSDPFGDSPLAVAPSFRLDVSDRVRRDCQKILQQLHPA